MPAFSKAKAYNTNSHIHLFGPGAPLLLIPRAWSRIQSARPSTLSFAGEAQYVCKMALAILHSVSSIEASRSSVMSPPLSGSDKLRASHSAMLVGGAHVGPPSPSTWMVGAPSTAMSVGWVSIVGCAALLLLFSAPPVCGLSLQVQ